MDRSLLSDPRRLFTRLFRDTIVRLEPGARVESALATLPWSAEDAVVVALGKCAAPMFAGAERVLSEREITISNGLVVTPVSEHSVRSRRYIEMVGSHPLPDERSARAARALLRAVAEAPPTAEILALVSGGGSALAALPAEGIALVEKVGVTRALAERGASIAELNVVRKHLSAIKGGQLAKAAAARVTTLVASDVVGDDLATVASGPTVADPTSFADACAVLDQWLQPAEIPAAVRVHLERGVAGDIPDTPSCARPGDRAFLVAGTDALLDAAEESARALGLRAHIAARSVVGDVAAVGDRLVSLATASVESDKRPVCLLAGGEPTLALPTGYGRGGRAHQLALYLARALHDQRVSKPSGPTMHVLIAGSDGVDGNSGAAGAIVDDHTWQRLQTAGVDGERALRTRDAASALAAVDASLVTGSTGVNHADLMVIVAGLARN